MIAALFDWRLWAAVALAFVAGGAGGIKWQQGVQARVDLAAAEARATDSRGQIRAMDKAAGAHAAALTTLNKQLGAAREKIANLSGRECLDSDVVRVLNDIGDKPVRAPASHPESAPPAVAVGGGLRFATDRDAAGAIAVCRARYSEVSSQLNQILDIEDGRTPPGKSP
jgi:hypothetical protein